MLQQELRQVAALYARGEFEASAKRGEALLASFPTDPTLLQVVGIANCQSGNFRKGASYLKRALQQNPGSIDIRLNLARAYLDAGEPQQAETVCASAGETSPELLRLRGDILKTQRRLDEALACYEQVIAAQPSDAEAWNNLGNARLEQGDAEGASEALRKAVALRPGVATIHVNLGRALAAASHYQDSLLAFDEAVRLEPKNAVAVAELGKALNRVGHSKDALRALSDAARLDPRNPDIFVAIGLTFAMLGEADRAEEAYRMALHVDPRYGPAYTNLAVLLEQGNRAGELGALLASAEAKGVADQDILYLRALHLRREGRLDEALKAAQAVPAGGVEDILRYRLIGQIADRFGLVDQAFAAFEEMNRATARDPSAAGFDGTEHRRYVQRLLEFTTPGWVDKWPSVEVDRSRAAPVFLVGFPRSGTTLLDTILMSHPRTHVLEEEPALGRVKDALGDLSRLGDLAEDEVNRLRGKYFTELDAISPAPDGALVIDKLPLNILRVPLIKRIFPEAKFIFAQRHPCDAVLSCFMQSFKVNQAMASFLDLHNAAAFYDRVLTYWQRCQEVFPMAVHNVRYEAMVEDTEGEVRQLISFLELPWDDRVLDHQRTALDRGTIRTPSYAQVTEGVYTRSRGRWERYRRHMEDVLPVLAPWAVRLGYDPLDEPAL